MLFYFQPMKIKLTLTLLLVASAKLFAQETESPEVTNVTRVTFLQPGFSYELKTGRMQSLYINPYVVTISSVSYSSTFGWNAPFNFDPMLLAHYRFYYNGDKRAAKGKRTEMNSMNYLTPVAQVSYPKRTRVNEGIVEEKRQVDFGIGALWGMQRNYRKRFSLDLNMGVGCYFWNEVTIDSGKTTKEAHAEFSPAIQFSLGFWLNKR